MKKFPLSDYVFEDIIKENYIYVDKTKELYDLINYSRYVFLSRPRRFGKSLLISTLKSLYEGKKELFKGLWIEDKIEWETYPVIHIDFSRIYYAEDKVKFQESFTRVLGFIAEAYGIEIEANSNPDYLDSLLQRLYKKMQKKVVILIDEYDKPITSYVTDIEKAKNRRDWLREYYAILKPNATRIKQIVITGISKYAKTAIFSELNNVKDITLRPEFNSILGFTQQEIEKTFGRYIKDFEGMTGWPIPRIWEEIERWYDGYSWNGIDKVYNPFSIVNLFHDKSFENYWFQSGTPKMLVDFIVQKVEQGELQQNIEEYENFETDKDLLDNVEVENIDIHSLLFQTGYLTIKEADVEFSIDGVFTDCTLGFPNREVQKSMTAHLLEAFSNISRRNIQVDSTKLKRYLLTGKIDKFIQLLRRFFGLIPYQLRENADEAYYHSLFQMVLTLVGVRMDAEKSTAQGRIDGVLEFSKVVYIIEFKYGKKGTMKYLLKKAFQQMKDNNYAAGFQGTEKEVQFLAIGFLEKEKNKKGQKILAIDGCVNDKPEYPNEQRI